MRGARDWRRVPLLDKARAAELQERLVVPGVAAPDASYEAGVVSSATTRTGRPLRVLRARGDVAAGPPDAREARTLQLYSPRHGVRPPSARVLLPAVLHANTVDVVDDLLSSRRFDVVVTPLSTWKWVTAALLLRGRAPADYGLSTIGTTGYAVTRRARRWLEGVWRAPLVDNYSLSELVGYFYPCARCGFAHWEGAPTLHEVLDLSSTRPARGALGELVSTTILPHGARMPLLRYRTGDVVERGPRCPAAGARGLRFRGRMSTSLFAQRRGRRVAAVLSRDLQDAVEELPDVALEPHPAERLGLVPASSEIGVPRARVKDGVVEVELRYDPARFVERARDVEAAVRRACLVPGVDVVLRAPGSLDFTREARKL